MLKAVSIIIAIAYLASCGAFFRVYVTENSGLRTTARAVSIIAVLLHIGYLAAITLVTGHHPITSMFEALTTLALMIVLVFFYIDFRVGAKTVGTLIFFLAFIAQAVSSVFITFEPGDYEMMRGIILPAHVYLALLGYAAYATAFLYSVMYLLLYGNIKSGRFGRLFRRFPSLEELDEMNYRSILVGLALMLVSIILGFVWSYETFTALPLWDAKVMFTLFTWMVYAVIVVFKFFFGWHGRRNAILSLCGFLLVVISFSLINTLAGSFHVHY